jgi:predicted helicase
MTTICTPTDTELAAARAVVLAADPSQSASTDGVAMITEDPACRPSPADCLSRALVVMKTPDSALDYVRDYPNDNSKDRGDVLEDFMGLVAFNCPRLFPDGVTDVEMIGAKEDSLGFGQHAFDAAITYQGRRKAVQIKNYSHQLGRIEASGYVHAFNERKVQEGWDDMMFVCMDGFSDDAAQVFLRAGVQTFSYWDLKPADVGRKRFIRERAKQQAIKFPKAKKLTLRPWNRDALRCMVASTQRRNLIPRATGTGKTVLFGAYLAKAAPDLTLIAVPSIELVRQTVRRLAQQVPSFQFRGVCSGILPPDIASLAGGIFMLSKPHTVRDFLLQPGKKVVVTTYHSVEDAIMPAAQGIKFDYAVLDEAHNMAGTGDKFFSLLLDDANVYIERRDFFTATPRVTDFDLATKATALGISVHSMDDTALFGTIPTLGKLTAELTLTEAMRLKAVTPFDILIGCLPASYERDLVYAKIAQWDGLFNSNPKNPASIHDVAQAYFFLKCAQLGRSYLTFHTDTTKADRMEKLLRAIAAFLSINLVVLSVDGNSTMRERRAAINLLANKDPDAIHVVTNCKLFGEGIDCPALDGVCFFDPKHTTIGIGQAIGRALRIDDNNLAKRAQVIVPIFSEDVQQGDDFTRESRYANLYSISTALRDLDVTISDIVYEHRETAQVITSRRKRLKPSITTILPTPYNCGLLFAQIKSLVLQGNLQLTRLEIKNSVIQFAQTKGRAPSRRSRDKNEAKLARLVEDEFGLRQAS